MNERITLPDLSDDENDLLNALLDHLNAKRTRNLLRASYYDGKRAIRQLTPVVPPHYYRLGIVLGWSAKAVDVLARRCNLDGFVWPDGDLGSLGLSEWWEDNLIGAESNSGIISTLIHSVSFLVNVRGESGEPTSLLHVRDAMNATGQWEPRARRMKNLVSVTDREDDKITGLVLYLDGVTITAQKDAGAWTVGRTTHPWGVPVEPLVYKPRVARPFGSSRISRPVMALQDQAVREVIRAEGHMDVFSFPEMWMLGADESVFKDEQGNVKPTWQVMLGRIKGIPDDDDGAVSDALARADVKQFPAASPEPHLAWLNALAKLFARETSLPDTALAITDVSNPTSAESYDASQYELIAEAEGVVDDMAPAFRRAALRGLAIQNGYDAIPAEWRTIAPKWRDPRYQSRAAMADAGMKQLAAVPWLAESEVGLELLGLDDQQIKRALADKRRVAGRGVLDALRQAAAPADQQATDGNVR